MPEIRKGRAGAEGVIRSQRLPQGGVRIELVTALDRAACELTAEQAKAHALGVLKNLEPLTPVGAAAMAVERGGNHG
jgi:hypothetical protein